MAHDSETACCRAAYGAAGCGKYCYVKDDAAKAPNRECRVVRDLEECANWKAAGRKVSDGLSGIVGEECVGGGRSAGWCATWKAAGRKVREEWS